MMFLVENFLFFFKFREHFKLRFYDLQNTYNKIWSNVLSIVKWLAKVWAREDPPFSLLSSGLIVSFPPCTDQQHVSVECVCSIYSGPIPSQWNHNRRQWRYSPCSDIPPEWWVCAQKLLCISAFSLLITLQYGSRAWLSMFIYVYSHVHCYRRVRA